MDLFNFLKSKNNNNTDSKSINYSTFLVNDIFYINIPKDWNFFQSDRFRTVSEDGNTLMSISNYEYDDVNDTKISKSILENMTLPMYEDFEVNGDYYPYDDLESTEKYISKSFKVDEETQYFLTTGNTTDESLIITTIIIRDIGEYKPEMRQIIKTIFESIRFI